MCRYTRGGEHALLLVTRISSFLMYLLLLLLLSHTILCTSIAGEGGLSRTNQYLRYIVVNLEELRTIKEYRTREWEGSGVAREGCPLNFSSCLPPCACSYHDEARMLSAGACLCHRTGTLLCVSTDGNTSTLWA
jgi:hypothetical protein